MLNEMLNHSYCMKYEIKRLQYKISASFCLHIINRLSKILSSIARQSIFKGTQPFSEGPDGKDERES